MKTTSTIAILHSIRAARKVVVAALNQSGVKANDYHYSPASENGGQHSAFSVEWTAKQAESFNEILDNLQSIGNNPEVAAVEMY